VSDAALLRALDRALDRPAHVSEIYTRYGVETPDLRAQVLVLPRARSAMAVQADKEALEVDFRVECTRPDVPGRHRRRPGFLIPDELDRARRDGQTAVLVNGNNLGYWGNQFAVDNTRLIYKDRGPIFDDRRLALHVVGEHAFFGWTAGRGYGVDDHRLDVAAFGAEDTGVFVLQPEPEHWPAAALTGYPLLRGGREVWFEARARAWDPRLLYDTGRLTGVSQVEVQREIEERAAAGEPLIRHALTAVGVDERGDALLLVAEQSSRSLGLTVASAARVLRRLGARDALALGAAGDAQLATTEEGFLVTPLVAPYASADAQPLADRHLSPCVPSGAARPVPCLLSVVPLVGGDPDSTASLAVVDPERTAAFPAVEPDPAAPVDVSLVPA
jgi:hypothetical protein